ncbi:MAG: outer membrane beta-barrel protein [Pseudomonadota bacterium]
MRVYFLAVATLIATEGSGFAQTENWYGRASVGFGRPLAASVDGEPVTALAEDGNFELDLSTGFSGALAVGRRWGDSPIRTEFEYRFIRSELDEFVPADEDSGSLSLPLPDNQRAIGHFILAGATWDFDATERFRLYVGGALGAANVNGLGDLALGVEFDDSSWEFAFQARAGIGYGLTEKTSVGIDYAFVGTSDPDFSTTPAAGLESLNVGGLRVSTINFFVERAF